MNNVLLIVLLLIAVGFVTPLSFAAEISGSVERVIQAKIKKVENPNPTLAPEKNCDNCLESQVSKTEIKSNPTPNPSLSVADVRGIEATPKPTVKTTIKPTVKPVTSPSPLSSPSASISASPSAQPTIVPTEKQTPTILKIWNWILNLFSSQA